MKLLGTLLALALLAGCSAPKSPTKPGGPTGVDDTQIAMDQASADLADSAAPEAPSGMPMDVGAPMGAPDLCDERFPNDRVITPDSASARRRAPLAEDAIREGLACYVALRDTRSSWCCKL